MDQTKTRKTKYLPYNSSILFLSCTLEAVQRNDLQCPFAHGHQYLLIILYLSVFPLSPVYFQSLLSVSLKEPHHAVSTATFLGAQLTREGAALSTGPVQLLHKHPPPTWLQRAPLRHPNTSSKQTLIFYLSYQVCPFKLLSKTFFIIFSLSSQELMVSEFPG